MVDSHWPLRCIDELKAPGKGAIAIGPFGSRMKSDCYVPVGVPVIRGTNIGTTRDLVGELVCVEPKFADQLGNANVYPDDLVFPHRGSIGLVGIVPRDAAERYVISSSLMKLSCDLSQVEPLFLFYFFRSADGRHELLKNASTVGTPGIGQPLSSLRSIKVPLPPLGVQKEVVSILRAVDDKIELNRRVSATLESMARALFQSWFVDFDPVRAKLDGKALAGVPAEIVPFFPGHFGHSEAGALPEEWSQVPIGTLVETNGWTLAKSDDLKRLEYVEISEVNRGDISQVAQYERGDEPSRARRRLRHGDTVLSTVRPDRGSYFLALNPPENRVASTGFVVLTPREVPWSFVHAAMTRPEVFEHLGQMADGGAYPAVRPEIVSSWTVTIPDNSTVLDAFHSICGPLYEKAAANREQSRTLAALRDTLLPKLLSGELRVKDAESLAGEVA
jgi:type I restriction enzyme S subunit